MNKSIGLFIGFTILVPCLSQAVTLEPDFQETMDAESSGNLGFDILSDVDISGDGIDDLIIGAPANDDSGTADGRPGSVYIYYGGKSGPNDSPDITINGENSGDTFGRVMTSIPDLTGDNITDLIIAAPYAQTEDGEENGFLRGKIYFLSSESIAQLAAPSSTNISEIAPGYIYGNDDWGLLGGELTSYNANGSTYLIASAMGEENLAGAVYFFNANTLESLFSSTSPTLARNSASFSVVGETADDYLGLSVLAWDEAGYVVVAATQYGNQKGRLYFFDTAKLDSKSSEGVAIENVATTANAYITGSSEYQRLGHSLADFGDASVGTGRYLGVGAPLYTNTESNDGRVYVFTASLIETLEETGSNGIAESDSIIDLLGSAGTSDQFGVDLIGIDNSYVAIGERGYGNNNLGATFLFTNTTLNTLADDDDVTEFSAPATADAITTSNAIEGHFGLNVEEFAEDLDNDDINELIVAAPGNTITGSETAAATYIIMSALWYPAEEQQVFSVESSAAYSIAGEEAGDNFGNSAFANGDYDDNGDIDLVIAAEQYNNKAGKIYAFYNLEDVRQNPEHLLATGSNQGQYQVFDVEERANSLTSVNKNELVDNSSSVNIALGDVDADNSVELITTPFTKERCHVIKILDHTTNAQEKRFKACHPNKEATHAFITSGDYNGNGQSEIAVAFPNANEGVYIQLYKRTSAGKYIKLVRKKVQSTIDFSQGINVSSGYLTRSNKEQLALAATTGKQQVFVYSLGNNKRINMSAKKTVSTKKTGLHIAIDGTNQTLYVSKDGEKKTVAYTWSGSKLLKNTSKNIAAHFKPQDIAAEDGTVALVKKNRKTVQLFFNGAAIRNTSLAKKIWSIDMINQ